MQLLKSCYLPIILYAIKTILPNKTVKRMLDNLINRAVCKIFSCSSAVDIEYIRKSAGLPVVEDTVRQHTLEFVHSF